MWRPGWSAATTNSPRSVTASTTRLARARLRTVAIVGDPGVGKSRLLYEFESWVELLAQEVYYLKARALATRQNVPYGVFRDLIATRFSILDSDPAPTVIDKLRDGFAPHLGPDEADLVGHWLGFDLSSSEAVRRLHGSTGFSSVCAAHLATFLRSLAHEDLVLMVLEDLHWADADSLDLLDDLAHRLDGSAALVVVATRPTLLDERPNVLSADVPCRILRLAPLGSRHEPGTDRGRPPTRCRTCRTRSSNSSRAAPKATRSSSRSSSRC